MIDWTHIAVATVGGIVSTISTVAVLRNDVRWIRHVLDKHVADDDKRFSTLEKRLWDEASYTEKHKPTAHVS